MNILFCENPLTLYCLYQKKMFGSWKISSHIAFITSYNYFLLVDSFFREI